MKKEDLNPGDVVWLKHDSTIKYTYLGETGITPKNTDTFCVVHKAEYGVFAYNPAPNYALVTLLLPYEAVNKV